MEIMLKTKKMNYWKTFYVNEWEILKPVKRLTKLFGPIDYLYNNDFIDPKYEKEY